MTQNIRFEAWEAEQMRDPEFRAAVEKLEPEYQNERSQMTSQLNILQNRINEQDERITALEKQVARHAAEAIPNLSVASVEQSKRIEKLEQRAADRVIGSTWNTVIEHTERIEKLEAGLAGLAAALE